MTLQHLRNFRKGEEILTFLQDIFSIFLPYVILSLINVCYLWISDTYLDKLTTAGISNKLFFPQKPIITFFQDRFVKVAYCSQRGKVSPFNIRISLGAQKNQRRCCFKSVMVWISTKGNIFPSVFFVLNYNKIKVITQKIKYILFLNDVHGWELIEY